MIGEPYNDRACLGAITEHARERATSADVQTIAARFATAAELAAWIRTLPQKNDDGDPLDGPKVACDVPQRLRIPTTDPNCVERAAFYLAAAESIEPGAVRALATIDTELGRHTFPVEDGREVVLNPTLPRNALAAGLDLITAARGAIALPVSAAAAWAFDIAEEPAAAYVDGFEVLTAAHATAGAIFEGEPIDRQGLAALLWVLALAEREQVRWWPMRGGVIRRVVESLAGRARGLVVDGDGCGPDAEPGEVAELRNCYGRPASPELERLGIRHKSMGGDAGDSDAAELRNGWRIEWAPRRYLSAAEGVARAVEPVARPLLKPAIKAALASYGVPPELVDAGDAAISSARSNRERSAVDAAGEKHTNNTNHTERNA